MVAVLLREYARTSRRMAPGTRASRLIRIDGETSWRVGAWRFMDCKRLRERSPHSEFWLLNYCLESQELSLSSMVTSGNASAAMTPCV